MATSKITNLSILDDAVRTAGIQDAAVTAAKTSGVPTLFLPTANPLIINGDLAIAQRGVSFAAGGEQYTLDRFRYEKSNDGVVTITQEALTSGNAYTDGFSTALKVDVTTADTNFTTNQRAYIEQRMEAQNLQVFKKGTANAEKFTLAFWIKATKTGTNVVRLHGADGDRSVSAAYTVDSTDTWEFKVLNFPADTTGVINNDNGEGLTISWGMAAGPSYTSGTLRTTWGSGAVVSGDFVGQVNNFDSTSNNWHLTGVQLEVGEYTSSTIPPFQHESYGDNLARCMRYFQAPIYVTDSQGSAELYSIWGCGVYTASGYVRFPRPLPVEMRANPSLQSTSGTNYFFISSGANDEINDLTIHPDSNYKTAYVYNNDEASGTAGQAAVLMGNDAAAYAWLNAEL